MGAIVEFWVQTGERGGGEKKGNGRQGDERTKTQRLQKWHQNGPKEGKIVGGAEQRQKKPPSQKGLLGPGEKGRLNERLTPK